MGPSMKALMSRRTSIRFNVSANLLGKILAAAVGLACIPTYIHILGVAGYGVIGMWITLETLAMLLDLGLSPTITRELAATAQRAERAQEVRDLVRTIEVAYCGLGLLIGAAIVVSAAPIATYWLRSSQLSLGEVRTSVELIGVLILCRWPLSFYSSGLTGIERQVLLSWMTCAFAVVRNLGAIVVLVFVSPTILAFLVWQIAINIGHTGTTASLLWWSLPAGGTPRFRPELLRRIWKFAGGVTATALVSVLLSDLDKLVVSGLLSLEEFGFYTLASRMAATLYLASSSVFAALYPAFVRLATAPDEPKLAELYHRGAQMMSVLVLPAAITGALFARPAIFAWTGNELIADNTAPIASLLMIGTAFHCVLTVPYAAQLAYGWTSLAFWVNLSYVPITTVLLVVLTKHFGTTGAAGVWLLINASWFGTHVPLMHRRLLRNEARRWYVQDVGIPLVACGLTAALIAAGAGPTTTRLGAGLTVVFAGLLVGAVGLLATPLVLKQLRDVWTQIGARSEM